MITVHLVNACFIVVITDIHERDERKCCVLYYRDFVAGHDGNDPRENVSTPLQRQHLQRKPYCAPSSCKRCVCRLVSRSISAISAADNFGPGLRTAADAIAPRAAMMCLRTARPATGCCS